MKWPLCVGMLLVLTSCRIERVSSADGEPARRDASTEVSGEVWIYTSMYRPVLDGFDALLAKKLPKVTVRWFQAGSEKIAHRLEAELAAGGTQADLLASADPFLFERLKREGRLAPYASVRTLKTPRELFDPDGAFAAARVSTMVLVHRKGLANPPSRFRDLTEPRFRGRVALGDPLTSGTAFTWAVAMETKYGERFFTELRANNAAIAGGNAAVLQKLQGGEADVAVLLLENALIAQSRGTALTVVYPEDGAVVIPGFVALFESSRRPAAARAVYEVLLSPEGQELIVQGDMHAADPALRGPRGEPGLDELLRTAQPWTPELLEHGLREGARVKNAFARAFAK